MQQPDYPARFHLWPELMTAKDVASALGVSHSKASQIMNLPGFPLLDPTKKSFRQVNKYRFIKFLRGETS